MAKHFILLFMIRETLQMFAESKERSIVSGQVLSTLTIPKEYGIYFEVYLSSFSSSFTNLIHLTTGDNECYGCRISTIFLGNENTIVVAPINGNGNYYATTNLLTIKIWNKVIIRQYMKNGFYINAAIINGKTVYSVQNNDVRTFENVKIYVSDIWYAPQPGYIRNFIVTNPCLINTCGLLLALSSSSQNNEINLCINMTTDCICSIRNVTLYLQSESMLTLKSFVWDGIKTDNSFVEKNSKLSVVHINEILEDSYVAAIAVYGVNISTAKANVSIAVYSSWIYGGEDPVFKVNQQTISTTIERPISPVIKMSSAWNYKQLNGTILQTKTHQFICGTVQIRQPSPCYQREVSSGIIKFLPIHLLDVFAYDSNTMLIYGHTTRNNIVEVNISKNIPNVISKQKCSELKVCGLFVDKQ
ncbi:uncharacterized protein LOC100203466 [Hydra vulgaris]|uniref:uncharacterized protein LOC100203466 n=1 Tax=Hydra vulgaris TaxID=6087 RepID=UPI001F5F82D4|nr:uncharacterized protein LOC100203466 [Hydra vulgaris]